MIPAPTSRTASGLSWVRLTTCFSWVALGVIAFVALVVVFYLMVVKPT